MTAIPVSPPESISARPRLPQAPRRGKPEQAPQTLAQLFALVVRSTMKSWLWRIPLALVGSFAVWLLHTFLLVVANDGFNAGNNWFLDMILALQGRMASGTIFWTLFGGLLSGAGMRFLKGPAKFVRDLMESPTFIRSCFAGAGPGSFPLGLLAAGGAGALLASAILANRLASLLLALTVFFVLAWRLEDFWVLVARLAWTDAQRVLNRQRAPRPLNLGWAGLTVLGASLGFLVGMILPWQLYCGGAAFLVLAALSVALIVSSLSRAKGARAASVLLLVILYSAFAVTGASADDGGWSEAGGSFAAWIASEGAIRAVAMGFPAAAGMFLGLLAGGLSGVAGGLTAVPSVPVPPPPAGPPGFQVNDQGQVWYQPPWDEGGHGWVDRAEFDVIQRRQAEGMVWNNTYGWLPPDEPAQRRADVDRWREASKGPGIISKEIERDRAERALRLEQARRSMPPETLGAEPAKKVEEEESFFDPEVELEFSRSRDLRGGDPDKGVSLGVKLVDGAYYDADDVTGQAMGIDYKADVQLGAGEAGFGFSRDSKGEVFVGAYGEFKAYNFEAEGVYGSSDLAVTSGTNISAGKLGGSFGYKDGTVGGSFGGSLVSGEVEVGANVAGVNVGVNAGLSFGFELGLQLGKKTEVKLGPFTIGLSFGAAKTAN